MRVEKVPMKFVRNLLICIIMVKSDRINALRKKYDAYLEEDKKRKERNEYILEKLDKMRCCTAMVPLRHKSILTEDHRQSALYNVSNSTLEKSSIQPIPSSNQIYIPPETTKVIDESILLQEISKKYILIPKSRPVYNNNYLLDVKPEKDENNDWKSKYDILEQLKQNEKETGSVSLAQATCMLESEKNTEKHDIPNATPTEAYKPEKSGLSEQSHDYHHDLYYNDSEPEKEILNTDQTANITKTNNQDIENEYDNSYEVANNQNLSYTASLSAPKQFVNTKESFEFNELKDQDYNLETGKPENNLVQNDESGDILSLQEQYKGDEINNKPVDSETYFPLTTEDVNATKCFETNDFVEEVNKEEPGIKPDIVEQVEYPIDTLNTPNFTPYDNMREDGVNVDSEQPETHASGEGSYFNTDQVAIENNEEILNNDFDPIVVTENANLDETPLAETYPENVGDYYDEQTNANYEYNEGSVDQYNAEYPVENQNFNQEEYAAYYEGAQTEQPYAIEANENDAALQQYDQNYEQQYGDYNQQDYQQGYEQQYSEQAYEQNEYRGQQDLENSQQETVQYDIQGETQQYVEQVLDNEEHYIVEKQNEPIETSGMEKTLDQQLSPQTEQQQQQVTNAQ